MPENAKRTLIYMLIICIICTTIIIIYSYFDFKKNLSEKNYEKKVKEFKNQIFAALFPGVNIIYLFVLIYVIIAFYFNELLDTILKYASKQVISNNKELRILKEALIQANYFKNEEEIQKFINGKLIMDKLSK